MQGKRASGGEAESRFRHSTHVVGTTGLDSARDMNSGKQLPPPYHKGNSSDARRSLSDIQETMSQIYVTGICAMAGYSIGPTIPDVDKVDMTVAGTVSGTQASVRLQLKATYQDGLMRGDSFAYRIKDDELSELLEKARGHPNTKNG